MRTMLVHARLFAAVAVGVVLGCGAPTSDTPPREVAPSATATPATPVVAAPEGLPDAEELLSASVAALGGAEKIEAITSYYPSPR